MDDLLKAHRGLNEIISAYYPDDAEDEDSIVSVRSSFSSLNNSNQAVTDFLECISLLTAARTSITCLTAKIESAKLTEASSELIHPEIIGKRITWCQEAEKHLRSISENKDLLVYHLQQPLVTNYLTMNYEYHSHLITLVEELVDMLNNVEGHIQLVKDHAQNSILQKSDSSINNTARTMSELRNTLDNIVFLQSIISGTLEREDSGDASSVS